MQREIGECSFAPSRKLIRILRRRIFRSYRSSGATSVSSYRAYLSRSSARPGFQDLTRCETRAKQKGVCEPVIRDSGSYADGKEARRLRGEKVRDRGRRGKKTERGKRARTGSDISLHFHPHSRALHMTRVSN